jgi:hypothetical protein
MASTDWFTENGGDRLYSDEPVHHPTTGDAPGGLAGGEGRTYTQAFVYGPDGSYKTSGDPNGQWYAADGTPLPGRPAGPTGGAGTGYQPYSDDAIQAILEKYPPTNDGMRQADAEIQRTFGPGVVQLLDHPLRLDKFVTPTGTYDAVIGAGGANPQHGWMREGAGGGGGGATLGNPGGGGVAPGSLLGDPMAGRTITDDPSFKFRLDEGLKAMERSAASRGTLLTGGFMKAMQGYAQNVASTEYAASYGRRAQEQGNNFNRLFQVSGQGLSATQGQQQQASGYADNTTNLQVGKGQNMAGAAISKANIASANTAALGNSLGTLGTAYANRRPSTPQMPASTVPTIGVPANVNPNSLAGRRPNPYAGF